MHACFLDVGTVGNDLDRTRLEKMADRWDWYHSTTRAELCERLTGVDIVVTNKVVLDRAAIKAAGHLKLICLTATGYNNIDLEAAAERGIPVMNVTGYATAAVAQHVFALILAFATHWREYDAAVSRGAWQRSEFFCLHAYPIEELAGQKLGIVGHGELGGAVERIGRAFGMEVLLAERPGAVRIREGRTAFEQVLAEADYLSLHCPLNEQTRGMVDAEALARMRETAVLINTARGGLLHSDALIDALENGDIAGAAIDVLDREPPGEDEPLIQRKPRSLIVTPHTAWASRSARQRAIDSVADNIAAWLAGDDSKRVN